MDKKRLGLGALVVVLVIALAAAAVFFGPWADGDDGEQAGRPGVDETDPAVTAADAFAAAWQGGTLAEVAFTPAGAQASDLTNFITGGLTVADGERPKVAVTGVDRSEGTDDRAVATATVTWALDGGNTWRYDTRFTLVRTDGDWLVDWAPSVVEPSLQADEVLRVSRVPATRGKIVDTTGKVLENEKGSVTVGIRRSRTTDPAGTARTAAALTSVDPAELEARVLAAGPDDFVEVATLTRPEYDAIRSQIQPLPGTVFREEQTTSQLAPNFARAVLGTTGVATPEIAAASEGAIVAGDVTGLSGLQASQNATLAGSAGVSVQAVSIEEGATPRALKAFPPANGTNVTVTLDERVQTVADLTVANTATPSALVAIRVSTGDVLAVANGPSGSSAYNRAMIGKYPPGSVFKVASGLGLLQKGLTPDTPVDCPATIVVGKEFRNAEGEVLGTVPFRKDFADSCNTAFIGQSSTLTADELTQVAASLGYRELDVGLPLFGGSVPTTGDATEHAANMIGQGKVEASPFAVALASASVASGSSLNPRLIIDPASPDPVKGAGLPPAQITQLRDLMRAVVTDGTGSAVNGIAGGDVFGKTGTAEYGLEVPPRTHAWFTGYQGDIAFAVLVEDGGFGGAVAAPLAAQFLAALAGG